MMNGPNNDEEIGEDGTSQDDLIEYDPSGAEEAEPDPENEIDENELKNVYIEFIKNYQNSLNSDFNSPQQQYLSTGTSKDGDSVSCNVKYCKSINILNTELAFFSIPASVWSSGATLRKWKQALQREGDTLPIDFRICEKHFKPEHIEYSRKGKRLSRSAVPCLDLPSKEDSIVPYFSDINSIEQYIKGSAESFLDMKSRSISEDSLEGTSSGNSTQNLISVQMEVTEDLKTVVKPVTISTPNPGSVKMFTTPLRRVNHQNGAFQTSIGISLKPPESAPNIDPETVVIRKLNVAEARSHKRKQSLEIDSDVEGVLFSSFEPSEDGSDALDNCTIQIINPRAAKRSKSICSIRSNNSKDISAVQKVKPMQHKVVPIIHNDLLAAKKNTHQTYSFEDNDHEPSFRKMSKRRQSVHFHRTDSPKKSVTALHDYERRRDDKVQIKLSGPVTFQLADHPQIHKEPNNFPSSIKTEKQLRDMCGLNSFHLLSLLENFHRETEDIPNIKSKIILTFIKLKTNISFTFLSTIFGYDESTTQKIFQQTVKNLASSFEDVDFDFPRKNIDGNFQHFKFSLECIELQADDQSLKVFLKITPNGIVKYLGKNFSNRLPSGFQLSGLESFDSGDCIWIGKDVVIDDIYLKERGVRFVSRRKPVNTIQKIITKIKALKILEGRISLGLLPHIKNIMDTICGVCNLSDRC
ncbi:hypothetical protein ACFFRR_009304 [Megaselia abdita]